MAAALSEGIRNKYCFGVYYKGGQKSSETFRKEKISAIIRPLHVDQSPRITTTMTSGRDVKRKQCFLGMRVNHSVARDDCGWHSSMARDHPA